MTRSLKSLNSADLSWPPRRSVASWLERVLFPSVAVRRSAAAASEQKATIDKATKDNALGPMALCNAWLVIASMVSKGKILDKLRAPRQAIEIFRREVEFRPNSST